MAFGGKKTPKPPKPNPPSFHTDGLSGVVVTSCLLLPAGPARGLPKRQECQGGGASRGSAWPRWGLRGHSLTSAPSNQLGTPCGHQAVTSDAVCLVLWWWWVKGRQERLLEAFLALAAREALCRWVSAALGARHCSLASQPARQRRAATSLAAGSRCQMPLLFLQLSMDPRRFARCCCCWKYFESRTQCFGLSSQSLAVLLRRCQTSCFQQKQFIILLVL